MHIDIVEAGDPPSVITLAFSMTEHLFTCGFPLYSIATLHKNEFYVAGGGGQAKTGIPNAIVSTLQPLYDHFGSLVKFGNF